MTAAILARFKPYIHIGLVIGILMAAANMALSALAATPILGWLPTTVAGTGYFEDSRERVVQAVQEYRDGRMTHANRLGAIVGISNVREGIQLSVVAETVGPQWKFIGLAGAGLGIGDVAQYADLLLSSDLRPDVVVVGLSLHQLVDTRPKRGTVNVGLVDYVKRGDLRNTAILLRNSLWVYSRRQDVSLAVQAGLMDARAWMFGKLGASLPDAEAASRSPWREMIKSDWPEHFSAATLREEEEFFDGMGVFERATYDNSPKAMTTFIGILEQSRRKAAQTVMVLMPEHSTLQRRIPEAAFDVVKESLQREFRDNPPAVLDFRAAVPDSGFVNLAHLNRSGSLEFSRLLAVRMRHALLVERPLIVRRAVSDSTVIRPE